MCYVVESPTLTLYPIFSTTMQNNDWDYNWMMNTISDALTSNGFPFGGANRFNNRRGRGDRGGRGQSDPRGGYGQRYNGRGNYNQPKRSRDNSRARQPDVPQAAPEPKTKDSGKRQGDKVATKDQPPAKMPTPSQDELAKAAKAAKEAKQAFQKLKKATLGNKPAAGQPTQAADPQPDPTPDQGPQPGPSTAIVAPAANTPVASGSSDNKQKTKKGTDHADLCTIPATGKPDGHVPVIRISDIKPDTLPVVSKAIKTLASQEYLAMKMMFQYINNLGMLIMSLAGTLVDYKDFLLAPDRYMRFLDVYGPLTDAALRTLDIYLAIDNFFKNVPLPSFCNDKIAAEMGKFKYIVRARLGYYDSKNSDVCFKKFPDMEFRDLPDECMDCTFNAHKHYNVWKINGYLSQVLDIIGDVAPHDCRSRLKLNVLPGIHKMTCSTCNSRSFTDIRINGATHDDLHYDVWTDRMDRVARHNASYAENTELKGRLLEWEILRNAFDIPTQLAQPYTMGVELALNNVGLAPGRVIHFFLESTSDKYWKNVVLNYAKIVSKEFGKLVKLTPAMLQRKLLERPAYPEILNQNRGMESLVAQFQAIHHLVDIEGMNPVIDENLLARYINDEDFLEANLSDYTRQVSIVHEAAKDNFVSTETIDKPTTKPDLPMESDSTGQNRPSTPQGAGYDPENPQYDPLGSTDRTEDTTEDIDLEPSDSDQEHDVELRIPEDPSNPLGLGLDCPDEVSSDTDNI